MKNVRAAVVSGNAGRTLASVGALALVAAAIELLKYLVARRQRQSAGAG